MLGKQQGFSPSGLFAGTWVLCHWGLLTRRIILFWRMHCFDCKKDSLLSIRWNMNLSLRSFWPGESYCFDACTASTAWYNPICIINFTFIGIFFVFTPNNLPEAITFARRVETFAVTTMVYGLKLESATHAWRQLLSYVTCCILNIGRPTRPRLPVEGFET